jgi:hypothetical protein
MTISSERSKIARLESRLAELRKKDAQEARKEADFTSKANKATTEAAKAKSPSTIASKTREADTARKHAASATTARAGYAKELAQKGGELMKARAALGYEEAKLRIKTAKEIDKQQASQARKQRQLDDSTVKSVATRRVPALSRTTSPPRTYDVFISHASEDKDDFVRDLATKAKAAGLEVFYDEMTLNWGDSLRQKIEEGLANSRFGVVVLSEAFLKKEWPQRELDGLFGLEIEGRSQILPIWHKISKDDVMIKVPSLAGKLALNTAALSVDEIVEKLLAIIRSTRSVP